MRGWHDLTDAEWAIISPLPPDKPRGDQRDLSHPAHRHAVARPSGTLRAACDSLQPLGQARGAGAPVRGAGGALAGVSSSPRLLGGAPPPARRGRKKGGPDHAIGRSRGGLSSKIHVVVDRGCDSRTILKRIADHGSCPTSRPNGIAGSSAPYPITCTANATSSNVSSTSSSTSEASRPAITSLQETSSPQSPLPAPASGSKSMSTQPR